MVDNSPQMRTRVAGAATGLGAAVALAIPLIIAFEGMVPRGYLDPVGIATSCVGHVGPDVVVGRRYSPEECRSQLAHDLERTAAGIAPCLPARTPQPVQAAMVSFAFNVGPQAFCRSGVARSLQHGDIRGACAGLSRWVYARGRQLPGLVRRRAAERALCERGL